MAGDTGEKTEEATPEKLRKAREEGQVAKSQDLVGALGFTAGFFTLAFLLSYVFKTVEAFTINAFDAASRDPSLSTVLNILNEALPLILKVVLPIGGIVFVMGIFSNVLQTGFFLAFKVLTPKFDKINPVNGLKGMFKVKKLVELLKNMIKMGLAGWLAYDIMKSAVYDMTLVVRLPIREAVTYSGGLLGEYLIKTIVLFVLIGVVDLIWTKKQFAKEQRMSKYDVKQEYKQQEGDPQMKGQRKQLAQELLFGGGMENVKNADAVIVNPSHIAVAIQYSNESGAKAPKVVAKGTRIHAEKIKELAKHYGVPILRNVPLAQALNKLDIDEEIPEELYEAVAEVLSFVYKIREEQDRRQAQNPTEAGPGRDFRMGRHAQRPPETNPNASSRAHGAAKGAERLRRP